MGNELVELLKTCRPEEMTMVMARLAELSTSGSVNALLEVARGVKTYKPRTWKALCSREPEEHYTLDDQLSAVEALGNTTSKKALKHLRRVAQSLVSDHYFVWQLETLDGESLDFVMVQQQAHSFSNADGPLRSALHTLEPLPESKSYLTLSQAIDNLNNRLYGTLAELPQARVSRRKPAVYPEKIIYPEGHDITPYRTVLENSGDIDMIMCAIQNLGNSHSANAYLYLQRLGYRRTTEFHEGPEYYDYDGAPVGEYSWTETDFPNAKGPLKKILEGEGGSRYTQSYTAIKAAERKLKKEFRDFLLRYIPERHSQNLDDPELKRLVA